jgi:hypothetical protein
MRAIFLILDIIIKLLIRDSLVAQASIVVKIKTKPNGTGSRID